ncbi:MAG: ABC transporter substrate-binding protein [Candidatus Bathyarchaeia archaeon]|jgi:ABC-type transport system substrate-binding protein
MNTKAIVKSTAALIVIAIVLVSGLAGTVYYYSSRGPAKTTTATVPTPSFVSSQTYVGESPNQFQWLDPQVSYYQFDYEILNNQFEKLLWYNGASSTDLVPWLAESWNQTSQTQYTFKLRQGINFQDGTPFNAQAVWFSLNRLLIIDGTSGTGDSGTQAAWIVQQMLNTSLSTTLCCTQAHDAAWVQAVLAQNFVQIVDPYTININIMNPTTQFPYLLANEWADIVSPSFVVSHDLPSACKTADCPSDSIDYTAYFNHIAGDGLVKDNYLDLPTSGSKAGTGPYFIDSVNPTTYEIVMKAVPNYWGGPKNWSGPAISVSIKTLDFVYVPDLSTRLLDAKAGKATAIGVAATDIYTVADRDQWLTNGKLVSVVPGLTLYGPYPSFVTDWYSFLTNVTDATGTVRKFQPFADVRLRLAVADSINLTDAEININNRFGQVANQLIPPGTAPAGSYNPDIGPIFAFDLAKMQALLIDAHDHPLTNFVDENGHPYPTGAIDNSFSPSNPQLIEMYVGAGDTTDQRMMSIMASNLNKVATKLGLTFTIVPVPGGQYYTLASEHRIYFYTAGWVADYNHLLDWLGPMFLASGSYPSWHNMNYTALNNLYGQAVDADRRGDTTSIVQINNQMENYANQAVEYMYVDYPLVYAVRSSFLQGYYYNEATAVPYFATEYYTTSI